MRVLMLGWEFPPYISGGLGTACYGLTKALSGAGMEVLFVLPRAVGGEHASHVRLLGAGRSAPPLAATCKLPGVRFRFVSSRLAHPYESPSFGPSLISPTVKIGRQVDARPGRSIPLCGGASGYEGDLLGEVDRYARTCIDAVRNESFDVIHAHDWMTYPAGLAIAAWSGKPLVAHVHSTEFDRSGVNVHQQVYDIEREGMHGAAAVICVSRMTAGIVGKRYSVPSERIDVVYNGIEIPSRQSTSPVIERGDKVVLFLGRLTMQKGVEYFLAAARKVLTVIDDVKFIIAGSGDSFRSAVYRAAEMGIGHKVLFAGFLRGDDVTRAFTMADLYVMPSVSEPFGIAPLEAISHGVPVIISKSSGVSEVLKHALKVDFWDVDDMANKIVAALRYPSLASSLRENAAGEVRHLTWEKAAGECVRLYHRVADRREMEECGNGNSKSLADVYSPGEPAWS